MASRKKSVPGSSKDQDKPDSQASDEPAATPAEAEAEAPEPQTESAAPGPEAAGEATAETAEPQPDAAPDTPDTGTPDTSPPPAARPARRSGALVGGLIGGILAAAIGFGTAQYLGNDRWPFAERASQTEALARQLEAQAGQIDALAQENARLAERVASAEATSVELEKIRQNLQDLWSEEQGLIARVDELGARLADVENRPIPDVGATQQAVAAYETELAAMRQMLADELARIEQQQQDALDTRSTALASAENAVARALVAQLQAAIDTGADSGAALAALDDAGVAVPDALRTAIAEGVPTLAELQADFPPAARAALDRAVREQAEAGEIDPVTAFLRSQLGIRSLEPRDGSDPDAILARAEARLKTGDVAGALEEITALPAGAQDELADWRQRAERRVAAVTAARSLSATVNE